MTLAPLTTKKRVTVVGDAPDRKLCQKRGAMLELAYGIVCLGAPRLEDRSLYSGQSTVAFQPLALIDL